MGERNKRDETAEAIIEVLRKSGTTINEMISALGVARSWIVRGTPEYQQVRPLRDIAPEEGGLPPTPYEGPDYMIGGKLPTPFGG